MRAAWYEKNGAARDVLEVGGLPDPLPGPGEVRVRIHASGVNPSDVKARAGRPLIAPRMIPHSDGAGIIDAVGTGVAGERIGERVWTWNAAWQRSNGTAAEYVVLPQDQAVHLPDSTSFEEGACLGIPALTALRAVTTDGGVFGKTVLVTGGGRSRRLRHSVREALWRGAYHHDRQFVGKGRNLHEARSRPHDQLQNGRGRRPDRGHYPRARRRPSHRGGRRHECRDAARHHSAGRSLRDLRLQ